MYVQVFTFIHLSNYAVHMDMRIHTHIHITHPHPHTRIHRELQVGGEPGEEAFVHCLFMSTCACEAIIAKQGK
jgi:hypothetical protein